MRSNELLIRMNPRMINSTCLKAAFLILWYLRKPKSPAKISKELPHTPKYLLLWRNVIYSRSLYIHTGPLYGIGWGISHCFNSASSATAAPAAASAAGAVSTPFCGKDGRGRGGSINSRPCYLPSLPHGHTILKDSTLWHTRGAMVIKAHGLDFLCPWCKFSLPAKLLGRCERHTAILT